MRSTLRLLITDGREVENSNPWQHTCLSTKPYTFRARYICSYENRKISAAALPNFFRKISRGDHGEYVCKNVCSIRRKVTKITKYFLGGRSGATGPCPSLSQKTFSIIPLDYQEYMCIHFQLIRSKSPEIKLFFTTVFQRK